MPIKGLFRTASRSNRILFGSLCLWAPLIAAGAVTVARAQAPSLEGGPIANEVKRYDSEVRPLLKTFCFGCHGSETAKGDLRLDILAPDFINGADLESWHDALNRINLDEMPPAKAKQPNSQQRQTLVRWLTDSLRKAAEAKRYAAGRVVMRRLNREEYANTMRALLGVDLDFAKNLPPDPPSPEGFRNNGSLLEMSPVQLEAYLKSARQGLAEAIVSGEKPDSIRLQATKTASGKLPNRKVAGHVSVNPEFLMDLHTFPRKGRFRLRVLASAVTPPGHDFPRIQVSLGCVPGIVHVPRKLVGEADVTAPPDSPQTLIFEGRLEDFPQPGDVPFGNVDFDGMIALFDFLDADGRELRYPDRTYVVPKKKPKPNKKNPRPAEDAAVALPAQAAEESASDRLDITIHSVEFEAPLVDCWPPKSHTQILFPREDGSAEADEDAYSRQVIQRFMTRAFRRNVDRTEVDRVAELFAKIRTQSASFEESMRETLASVLVSPHFLYIVESRRDASRAEPVDDLELATRLSYFLWSSMPDDALATLARDGKLRNPDVLVAQVERMLNDPQADTFASQLADQWFDLDGLDRIAVNPEFYPDFDNSLKDHMRSETRLFLRELLRADVSCLDILDSNWTMLNRPLAKHYDLQGPRSSQFERVVLGDASHRGGLLGQGSFLLSNSNGETSHPIKRAVWLLDRLLDSPPAPPPPDVPELDPESADLKGLSLKEQLAVHREKDSCSNCHRGIDPWALPLENFDAVGRWRLAETIRVTKAKNRRKAQDSPAAPVDASTTLPDGTAIKGFRELKAYLLANRREDFARSVVRRLMTYALGRSLDVGDFQTVRELTLAFSESDFRLRSLVVALVKSEAFQTK